MCDLQIILFFRISYLSKQRATSAYNSAPTHFLNTCSYRPRCIRSTRCASVALDARSDCACGPFVCVGAEGQAAVHVWWVRLRSAARAGPLSAVRPLDAQRDGRAGQCAVAREAAHVERGSIPAQLPATPAAVCACGCGCGLSAVRVHVYYFALIQAQYQYYMHGRTRIRATLRTSKFAVFCAKRFCLQCVSCERSDTQQSAELLLAFVCSRRIH